MPRKTHGAQKKVRKRRRETLALGIYRDAYGVDVIARLGSGKNLRQESERFPLRDADGVLYGSTPASLNELKRTRDLLFARLRELPEASRGRGTFAANIDAFLADMPDGPKKKEWTYLLAHWRASELGAMHWTHIDQAAIVRVLETWENDGIAASTLNHRISKLRAVFESLRPRPDAYVPTDRLKRFREPDPENRGVPMDLVEFIFDHMPNRGRPTKDETRPLFSETKIRCRVEAWTGLSHMSLRRLPRKFVNFHERRMYQPPRKKGKGVKGEWVNLVDHAWDALKDYDAAGLWEKKFSGSSVWKSWRRAVTAARKTLERNVELDKPDAQIALERFMTKVPEDCRPYDARHSFLSGVYQTSGDIRASQALGQHASGKTTNRYTGSAVAGRVESALEAFGAAYAHLPRTPPIDTGRPRVRKFAVVGSAS